MGRQICTLASPVPKVGRLITLVSSDSPEPRFQLWSCSCIEPSASLNLSSNEFVEEHPFSE